MNKKFIITAFFALLCVGRAAGQDLPGLDTGAVPDAQTLPELPMTPGTEVQKIGGETMGMILASPVSTLPDVRSEPSSQVSSSVDLTETGALRNGQAGGRAPSNFNSSAWAVSGFGFSPSSQGYPAGSMFISRPDQGSRYSQRFGGLQAPSLEDKIGGLVENQSATQYGTHMDTQVGSQYISRSVGAQASQQSQPSSDPFDPSTDFSSQLTTDISANPSIIVDPFTVKSDVPDLTASPASFAASYAEAAVSTQDEGSASIFPGVAVGPGESSIQTPTFRFEDYGLNAHPPRPGQKTSIATSRWIPQRQRGFTSLHDRLAAERPGATLKARNSRRIHTGLSDQR